MPSTPPDDLQPDLKAAKQFLRLLDHGAVAFTFQTAHDVAKGEPKRRDLSWHGTVERRRLKPLALRNADRAAVWVMVNQGDGRGRKAENVQRVRAVFADVDGQVPLDTLREVDPKPHVIVESSPGHFQAYWLCSIPLDQFEDVQRAIAQRFGTDPVVDPCRVMRVPGFWHQKDPSKPFRVRIVHTYDLPPYPVDRILKAFPPRARAKPNGADLGDVPPPAGDAARFDKLFPLGNYASASERDHAVACAMVRQGKSDERIAAVLRALRGDGKGDRLDYLARTIANAHAEIEQEQDQLEELVEQSADDPGAPFQGESVDFLAALRIRDPAAYERAVLRLKRQKVRVGPLEKLITERLPEISAGPGRVLEFEPIEPWPHRVDGAELLDAASAHLKRFAVMSSEHATVAVVLWSLHCHALAAWTHTPRLLITSPTRECGKSHVMEWLQGVVPRPFDVVDPTGPTLFRPIEAHTPTVLIDEGDLVSMDERRDVRAVINAGHSRFSPGVPRCVGDSNEVRVFCVWAPMAYAMIGKKIPDAMLSRSIVIPMQRMLPDQSVEYRRENRDQGHAELRAKMARWAQDHLHQLRAADPDLPVVGRKANCWRPLIAIADAAGGEWPDRARDAARALSGLEPDTEGIGVQLLGDIKKVFGKRSEAIQTETLIERLTLMPEQPWAEYGKARKPISPAQLATLLRPFGIKPTQYKVRGIKHRGYRREEFEPVWSRYLEPQQ